jgi:5'(3')-deoxyribonucleotidase
MTDQKTPVLLLDMDGPIAGFDLGLWELCKALDVEMDIIDLDDPNRKYYMTENMVDPDDAAMVRHVINTTHFFRNLPVTPGALEGVRELMEVFDVWVCTKPLDANRYCRDDKMYWIKENFPDLHNKVIMAPKKSMVIGDILLDDAPAVSCIPANSWRPVVFTDTFNISHKDWGSLEHWSWGDDVEKLVAIANTFTYSGE